MIRVAIHPVGLSSHSNGVAGALFRLRALKALRPAIAIIVLATGFPIAVDCAAQESAAARPTLKDLDGHFPFTVPESAQQWKERAEAVQLQTRVALGVHPIPKLAEPVATIHSRREMDGYSIEKVILESVPGHYVTASLYRPIGDAADGAQKRPAVMYAHGHWDNGRFYEASPAAAKILIATGQERFMNAAINHMQAACVQLARMGCVVLQYDMIGYADSQQVSFARAHRWGLPNVDNSDSTQSGWPFFSVQAEGYGQSIMGLQTINTIQAFEMLRGLPDVDASRIAITGASGGGTQSFIATAVEPRLAGSLPAVMVSTAMQGGCVCENACGLRVATGNIELAGLTAPRPLAMTTANDWTINMPKDGFPELVKLYEMVGKTQDVQLIQGAHFPHNYNHVTRVAMYGWMNRLFKLGISEPILEEDFELLRSAELTVYDDQHPRPASGLEPEQAFLAKWAAQIDQTLALPADDSADARKEKLKLIGEGWRSITAWAQSMRGHLATSGALKREGDGEGKKAADVFLALGRNSGAAESESWQKRIAAAAGDSSRSTWSLVALDPVTGDEYAEAPVVRNPRPAAAYTYGYNAPPVIRRLGVVLDGLEEVRSSGGETVRLIASDDQVLLAVLAAVESPETVESVVWVTDNPQLDPLKQVTSIRDPQFIPNGLRYQGFAGLKALLGERFSVVKKSP
jgi:dienelactone hydrolase